MSRAKHEKVQRKKALKRQKEAQELDSLKQKMKKLARIRYIIDTKTE